ncbi:hypothetical protein MNAN1_003692 [Malassezia nana]|uniref:Peptide N-acetyl-beta-D-glucosaminyl asparaginase amidase A N-terminal domain-containing protein n=1 Tax=Malassezia nana TaxID=180528 RepID=A0AAF0EPS2_9BASI|nr:hypothetical protein MNAN1_003692 [Malassezia nana]
MSVWHWAVLTAFLIISLSVESVAAKPWRFTSAVSPEQKSSPLNVFQLSAPVFESMEGECNYIVTLMEHTFGNSNDKPFSTHYVPPDCNFNRVVIHFNSTVKGRQYDRLGIMYLGSTEVWRTSTAEPTESGVHFAYDKDLTAYMSLWKKNQTLLFDLPNFVDDTYTGEYRTTLTAHFWHEKHAPKAADKILPISAENGQEGRTSVFQLPKQRAMVYHHISKKAVHAHVSISATGQQDEEFWYTNVFNKFKDEFGAGEQALPAGGPFREVQLLIDGYLAGVAWPMPVIFTGGIAPNLWRPTVGIDAFDLREQEIDITPWLPYLTDGKSHTFELRVVGIRQGQRLNSTHLVTADIGSYWLTTGKIFVFYGQSKKKKSHHERPSFDIDDPKVDVQVSHERNSSMHARVQVSRSLNISSAAGSWSQTLSYVNENVISENGIVQRTNQTTHTKTSAKNLYAPHFSEEKEFSMPLSLKTITTKSKSASDSSRIHADIDYELRVDTSGRPDVSLFSLASGAVRLHHQMTGSSKFSNAKNHSDASGRIKDG